MRTLVIRVVSALVGVSILFATYYFGGRDALALLCSLATAAFAAEFSNLLPGGKLIQWVFIVLTMALIYIAIFAEQLFFMELGLSFVLLVLIVLSRVGKHLKVEEGFHQLGFFGFGLIYCAVLPIFVIQILYVGEDPKWFALYLCLVFIGDTGAYVTGYFLGKHKLMEIVSPKKTVEGAIGGLISTLVACLIALKFFDVPPLQLMLAGFIVACVAQAGDLVESLLKRAVHVKDSGKIMPGHGGMMDRLDGVYFASPIFYWFLKLWTS